MGGRFLFFFYKPVSLSECVSTRPYKHRPPSLPHSTFEDPLGSPFDVCATENALEGNGGPSHAALSQLGPPAMALRFQQWHPVKWQQATLWAGQGSQEARDFINYYQNKLRGGGPLPQSTGVKIPLLW